MSRSLIHMVDNAFDLQDVDGFFTQRLISMILHRNSEIGSVLWSCVPSSDPIQMHLANTWIGHRFRCVDRDWNISTYIYIHIHIHFFLVITVHTTTIVVVCANIAHYKQQRLLLVLLKI